MPDIPHARFELPPEVPIYDLEKPYLFESKQIIGDERYQLLNKPLIARPSNFSTVYRAVDREAEDSPYVALKIFIERGELERHMVYRELTALNDFNGTPNILEATDMGIINEGPVPQHYLASRLAHGNFGALKGNPGSPKKIQASIDMASQIFPALAILHSEGVVHKDIKPKNILRYIKGDETDWVIADFGLVGATPKKLGEIALVNPKSNWLIDGDSTIKNGAFIGTPGYVAPELIEDPSNISPKVDIFGIGVTLFTGITGEFPFIADTVSDYATAVTKSGPVKINSVNKLIPTAFGSLTMNCLDPNPENRPTSEELVREIAAI